MRGVAISLFYRIVAPDLSRSRNDNVTVVQIVRTKYANAFLLNFYHISNIFRYVIVNLARVAQW